MLDWDDLRFFLAVARHGTLATAASLLLVHTTIGVATRGITDSATLIGLAATAGLELARIAATEADFAESIARCDAAIARVSKEPLRTSASPVLLPALMTESAVAMAARGGVVNDENPCAAGHRGLMWSYKQPD